MQFQFLDIALIAFAVLVTIFGVLYFVNRWSATQMVEQQKMIDATKQSATIFVIDKKKLRPQDASLPKVVMDNMPRRSKIMKMPFVKAKVGAQITTFMCDPRVFDAIPLQKQIKVDVAGIYIVDFKGRKTDEEMKAQKRAKHGPSLLERLNPFRRG
ncbi:MAG: hypothetical protein FWD96_00090 [Defluviitaleaceae bacterium]|nr:hypothetical protein [Defluviitaleaceae bacterium]